MQDHVEVMIVVKILCFLKVKLVLGDSGGGMYTNVGSVWYIRGIVSASLFRNDGTCDVSKYAVVTNVAKYTNWINSVVQQKVDLNCKYSENQDNLYECKTFNLRITDGNIKIAKTVGDHVDNRYNRDVSQFYAFDQLMIYLPMLISDTFPNLTIYRVLLSGLEFITRSNFEGLHNLTGFEFRMNHIEVFPKDVFYGIPNLIWMSLQSNQISSLDPDTFIKNPNLKEIFMARNKIEFLDGGLFRKNLKMEGIHFDFNRLIFIGPEILTPLKNLKSVTFQWNVCLSENYPDNVTLEQLKEVLLEKC